VKPQRVLIVGLFPDPNKNPITQAGELARILMAKGYTVYTVSKYRNKFIRIIDIILFITIHRQKFDTAIIQFYSGPSFIWQYIATKLVKFFSKKLVFTIHGGGVPARIKVHPGRYIPVLKQADAITCPSGFIIKELKQLDIPAVLIENSIPFTEYPFIEKKAIRPVLLWMRSFSDLYNPPMAVRVVAELKNTYPDVKLYMGGPDLGSLEMIEEMIVSLNLQQNIEIVGFMDFEKKVHYAKLCDIYIGTNKIDNAPVTFIEMWAMGLPIVTTNVGGIPYLANDNETALLVNDDDHVRMARRITELIESNSIATKLIANGRKSAERYSEDEVFKKWDYLLSNLNNKQALGTDR
jgi:glycosyltransferase involved in cell wall biosynthesis